MNKKAAAGVDGVTAKEYKENLYLNAEKLAEKVKSGKYRARLVRRKNIRKPNGKLRPLGIPATEDKLLQTAVGRILNAIYEQDFLKTSYGYRPGRGAKEAIRALTDKVREKYSYVVEADIQGFFDHIDHEWLMRMLNLRVGDGVIKRLIRKWLKARILQEDGQITEPEEGSPQGSVISPILANVYLHHVLDQWFENIVRKNCEGEAYLIRYADDCAPRRRIQEARRAA
jgi:group II intron reverse transcriptase/maturase